jgi:DNA-binding transcriptional regulator YdaS (Cro superfamily)
MAMEETLPHDNYILFTVFDATKTQSLAIAKHCGVSPSLVTGWRQNPRAIAPRHIDALLSFARDVLRAAYHNQDLSISQQIELRRMMLALTEYSFKRTEQYVENVYHAIDIVRQALDESRDASILYVLRDHIDALIQDLTTPKAREETGHAEVLSGGETSTNEPDARH